MDVLRTPDSRFENLEGYPFVANYIDVAASDSPVRMHFLDEGPADGPPIVLLHGEPTWSYLYRTMIPPLVDAGNRVLAPDLIGFGRSDKPSRMEDYTYLRHVEWVTAWFERLRLKEVTLFVQDWGSLIGLRIAAEQGERIARVVVANGFHPPPSDAPLPPSTRGEPLPATPPYCPPVASSRPAPSAGFRPRCEPAMTPPFRTRRIKPEPGHFRNWYRLRPTTRPFRPIERPGTPWAGGRNPCSLSSVPATRSWGRPTVR
ncbi:hypothetical protein MSTO_61060 [Mycobacterium stomatepiae]|uniref:AB hydrolase-1 domain-containing protein n=1 Tax=Mycobacterium stomatepiae TaxID=470076 RepID=A0A7I7QI00_9MYCO|nr:hypothetical protein MSTO_61060 [Mycobacterium stomatepiae]